MADRIKEIVIDYLGTKEETELEGRARFQLMYDQDVNRRGECEEALTRDLTEILTPLYEQRYTATEVSDGIHAALVDLRDELQRRYVSFIGEGTYGDERETFDAAVEPLTKVIQVALDVTKTGRLSKQDAVKAITENELVYNHIERHLSLPEEEQQT